MEAITGMEAISCLVNDAPVNIKARKVGPGIFHQAGAPLLFEPAKDYFY